MKRFYLWIALCLLGGCGGGSAPSDTPAQPHVALRLAPAIWQATVNEGEADVATLALDSATALPAPLYAQLSDATGTLAVDPQLSAQADGSYTLTLRTAALAPGHVTGIAQLHVCRDSSCTAELPGSPVALPFDLGVRPTATRQPLVRWAGIDDWRDFQGNAAHNGYVPVTLDPARFSLRWRWAAPPMAANAAEPGTLAIADGLVYAAIGNRLYARRESDGEAVWDHDFGDLPHPSTNPPATAYGMVYIVAGQSDSTFMFGLNAATGAVVFKTPMSSQWEHYLAPTVDGDRVYTNGGTYGGLYAFDAITGSLRWFAQRPQTAEWTPAAADGMVYSFTGALQVAAADSGRELQSIAGAPFKTTDTAMYSAPVLGANGSVFALNAGRSNTTLFNFSLPAGRVAWAIDGRYAGNPAYAHGTVYALTQALPALEARAETDGSLRWRWRPTQAQETVFVSDVLLTENLAFVSTNTATHAIDLLSQREVWRFQQSGLLALSANGILYIAKGGAVTAINLK